MKNESQEILENSIKKSVKMTNHFIERYIERIWGFEIPDQLKKSEMRERIFMDIEDQMRAREKNILEMFIGQKKLKIPFNKTKVLVIRDNILITVY